MLLITLFHAWQLPQFEKEREQTERSLAGIAGDFVRAFKTYFEQERVALVIIFIITYKIGDEILFSMGTPFLMRELTVTTAQLSWVGGILGALGAIAGTSIGGIWIKKKRFKKSDLAPDHSHEFQYLGLHLAGLAPSVGANDLGAGPHRRGALL